MIDTKKIVTENESLFIKNGFEKTNFGLGQEGYARTLNDYEVCATFETDYWLCGIYEDVGKGPAIEEGEFITAPDLLNWVFLANNTTGLSHESTSKQ